LFFGWYIVAAGFLVSALAYGARYSFAVFFPSLLDEFNWPRDLAASIFSVHLLFYGLAAPVAGFMVDRAGPRLTMCGGAGLLALGLILSGWGSAPWHFYLSYGVLTGTGLCFLGSLPMTTVLRNWFERRRGMVFSLLYLGGAVAYGCYPAVTWLIEHLGWRWAFVAEGVAIALIFIPLISLVIYYRPEQKGLLRDGLGGKNTDYQILAREARRIVDPAWTAVDWTLPRAFATGRFWLMCAVPFLNWGVGQHLLMTHHIAAALDAGFSKPYASAVLALNGLFYGLGTFAGILSDRIGREAAFTLGTVLAVSGVLVMAQMKDASHPWMLYYYAMAAGLGYGMCVPTVTAAVTDLFQGPKVGSTLGFVWFSFALGAMVGPWLGGLLFELGRNYEIAFSLAALAFAAGCAAMWLAAPRKVRLVPGRAGKILRDAG
jgi:MFS family permease